MRLIRWFILLLAIISFSCELEDENNIVNRFGVGYNEERKKIGLHPVTPEMQLIEDGETSRYIFVNKNQLKAKEPVYLRKIILVKSGGDTISHEGDNYFNPQEELELNYEHDYLRNKTIIVLQDAHPFEKPDDVPGIIHSNESKKIGFTEADSILKAWRIEVPERLRK